MNFCNHVGTVFCENCRPVVYGPQTVPIPTPPPVKCPECGVWWRTYTHICRTSASTTATGLH